jgi:hypothetical protein
MVGMKKVGCVRIAGAATGMAMENLYFLIKKHSQNFGVLWMLKIKRFINLPIKIGLNGFIN